MKDTKDYFPIILLGIISVLVVAGILTTIFFNPNFRRVDPPTIQGSSKVHELKSDELQMDIILGNDQISTKEGLAYILFELEGLKKEQTSESPPLNLSIVIDRSGSMDGEKLEYVKKALKTLANMLEDEDYVSIVIYDHDVQTVLQPQSYKKSDFLRSIDEIYSGGSTNLEGGLRRGIKEINDPKDGYVNRVLLLSDGLANVGLSDPESLGRIAQDAYEKGVTVSTIGVGADYDENIMTNIAKQGSGNYYFLEDPRKSEEIFAMEFKTMNIVAKNITVDIQLANGLKLVDDVDYELDDADTFSPNDLYSERNASYLFKIEADDLDALREGEITLAQVLVNYTAIVEGEEVERKLEARIPITVVDDEVEALADDIVYKQYMTSYYSQKLWDVDAKLDDVENDKAKEVLDEAEEEMEKANTRLDGFFESELESLKDKYEYIDSIGDSDVRETNEGKIFKKSNQDSSYQLLYNK